MHEDHHIIPNAIFEIEKNLAVIKENYFGEQKKSEFEDTMN